VPLGREDQAALQRECGEHVRKVNRASGCQAFDQQRSQLLVSA
jgi:hypothetical protein